MNMGGKYNCVDIEVIGTPVNYNLLLSKTFMDECKIMMVPHDALVTMKTWKNINLLNLRDYSRYFYNEFEYGVTT
jgi:hypothetical protein